MAADVQCCYTWRVSVSPAGSFHETVFRPAGVLRMGMPRRFEIPNDCLSCALRQGGDFCNLPDSLMTEFNAMGHLTLYPGNATLLTEGAMPRGVYIACSGRAKLSVEARGGKTIILKIAGDRHVMGL